MPHQPTREEWDQHAITHTPYRAWCPHCLKSRAREDKHVVQTEVRQSNIVSLDYGFTDDVGENVEERGKSGTLMIAVHHDTGYAFCAQAQCKGRKDKYICQALLHFIEQLGLTSCALQSDGESSIFDVVNFLKASLVNKGLQVQTRRSPTHDHQANGRVEVQVKLCKQMLRTMLSVVNMNYEVVLGPRHWCYPWAARHGTWLANRFTLKGSQTPYSAVFGREFVGDLVRFGETVMAHWITTRGGTMQKKWVKGIWVGREDTTNSHLIALDVGIILCRTVRRLPEEQQWDKECFIASGGTPWQMSTDPRGRGAARNRPHPHTLPLVVPPAMPVPQQTVADGGLSAQPREVDVASPAASPCEPMTPIAMADPVMQDGFTPISVDQPSSSDSSASMSPAPQGSSKRPREGGDSDEDERLRAAALAVQHLSDGDSETIHEIVSALVSPHDDEHFDIPLSEEELAASRTAELDSLAKFDTYEEIDLSEYQSVKPITTTWVDRRRGDSVKSRLCAREFRASTFHSPVETYAATPSAVSIRLIDLLACSRKLSVVVADVSSAFLHAEVEAGQTIIVIPPDDIVAKSPNIPRHRLGWKLRRWLYGLRGAPKAWQDCLSEALVTDFGFARSQVDPCLFWNSCKSIWMVVHVDDLYGCGPHLELEALMEALKAKFKLKYQGPYGPDSEFVFLGCRRQITEGEMTIRYESSYIEKALMTMEMVGCKAASIPWSTRKAVPGDELPLDDLETSKFRSATGQLLYVAHSRPDLQRSVRKLACSMKLPTHGDRKDLKHVLRYASGTIKMTMVYPRKLADITEVIGFSDSDWASPSEPSRRSITGGLIQVCGCTLTTWCKGQSLTATSSGEAEYYALCHAVSEGLYIQTLLTEMHIPTSVRIYCDSSAALGMARRLGASQRTRHMECRYYFLQQIVSRRMVTLAKVHGSENPADVLTKGITAKVLQSLTPMLGLRNDNEFEDNNIASLKAVGVKGSTEMLSALIMLLQAVKASGVETGGSNVPSLSSAGSSL